MYSHSFSAIIPFYDTHGANVTYTITEDGSIQIHPIPIKHFLNHLFNEFSLDPKHLRRWTSQVLYYKTHMPIILLEDLVFIPIKVRSNIGKYDGCFGYVLTRSIVAYDDYTITLQHNQIIKTHSSASYIRKKLYDAQFLSFTYKEQKSKYDFMHTHLFPKK